VKVNCDDVTDSHFLLANARIVDFPIVYCNEGLCQLTGFERSELMQKPAVCSAMHGEQTSCESIARLEDAMQKQIADEFEIQLYKKNSTCQLALLTITTPSCRHLSTVHTTRVHGPCPRVVCAEI